MECKTNVVEGVQCRVGVVDGVQFVSWGYQIEDKDFVGLFL